MAARAPSTDFAQDIRDHLQVIREPVIHDASVVSEHLKQLGEKVHTKVEQILHCIGMYKFCTLHLKEGARTFFAREAQNRYGDLCFRVNRTRAELKQLIEEVIPLFMTAEQRVQRSSAISPEVLRKATVFLVMAQASSVDECAKRVLADVPLIARVSKKLYVLERVAKERLDDLDGRLDEVQEMMDARSWLAWIPGATRTVVKVKRVLDTSVTFIPRGVVAVASAAPSRRPEVSISLDVVGERLRALYASMATRDGDKQLVAEVHGLLMTAHAVLFEVEGPSLEEELMSIGAGINCYHHIAELYGYGTFVGWTTVDQEDLDAWGRKKTQLVETAQRAYTSLQRLIAMFDEGIQCVDVGDFSAEDKEALRLLCAKVSIAGISSNQAQVEELKQLRERYRSLSALYNDRKTHLDALWTKIEAWKVTLASGAAK